jgi:hypothetical protein
MTRWFLLCLVACGSRSAPPRDTSLLGVEVGATSLADARAVLAARGLDCADASMAAVMPPGHGRYLKGELRQARIRCRGLALDGGVTASVLVVAPDDAAPVELVAIQRTHHDAAVAETDARAMFAALEARLGAPSERRGELPLARVRPVERRWRAGGRQIAARAVDLGATGIAVTEEVRAVQEN